jgi:hypothetical protein
VLHLVVRGHGFRLEVEVVLGLLFDEELLVVIVVVVVAGKDHIRHLARLRPGVNVMITKIGDFLEKNIVRVTNIGDFDLFLAPN